MSAVQRTAPTPPTHDPLNRLANAVLLGACSERSVPGDIIDILQKATVTVANNLVQRQTTPLIRSHFVFVQTLASVIAKITLER
jgi:hypothetical protein